MQLQIMQVLWQRGRATARQITDALNEDRADEQSVAHSTVQTLLRELEAKGTIQHETEERTFVFFPVVAQADIKESATRDLLNRLFDGSAFSLVAHLLKQESLSPEDLNRLREMIEEERKRQ
jgi:BlaI family penicillinase repressor